MIRAIPAIRKRVRGFRFVIIGSWGGDLEQLREVAQEVDVEGHLVLKGWIPPNEVPSYIGISDAGIIPHCVNDHTQTTLPNKLFDYMALGKPVISTNMLPVRRIVEREACGLIYNSNEELIGNVVRLFENQEEREWMGANGRRAVEGTYNWDHSANVLLRVVKNLDGHSRCRA